MSDVFSGDQIQVLEAVICPLLKGHWSDKESRSHTSVLWNGGESFASNINRIVCVLLVSPADKLSIVVVKDDSPIGPAALVFTRYCVEAQPRIEVS